MAHSSSYLGSNHRRLRIHKNGNNDAFYAWRQRANQSGTGDSEKKPHHPSVIPFEARYIYIYTYIHACPERWLYRNFYERRKGLLWLVPVVLLLVLAIGYRISSSFGKEPILENIKEEWCGSCSKEQFKYPLTSMHVVLKMLYFILFLLYQPADEK